MLCLLPSLWPCSNCAASSCMRAEHAEHMGGCRASSTPGPAEGRPLTARRASRSARLAVQSRPSRRWVLWACHCFGAFELVWRAAAAAQHPPAFDQMGPGACCTAAALAIVWQGRARALAAAANDALCCAAVDAAGAPAHERHQHEQPQRVRRLRPAAQRVEAERHRVHTPKVSPVCLGFAAQAC